MQDNTPYPSLGRLTMRDAAAARTLAENDAAAARQARILEHGEELVRELRLIAEDMEDCADDLDAGGLGLDAPALNARAGSLRALLAKIEGKS